MWFRSSFCGAQPWRKVRSVNPGHAGRRLRFETYEDRRMLSLTPAVNYPVGTDPQDIVTADFNGDGKIDLVVTEQDDLSGIGGAINVLLGNGLGGVMNMWLEGVYPRYGLSVADLNGDGNLDVATAGYAMLGNGNGTLRESWIAGWTGNPDDFPRAAAVGDLTGDDIPDLVQAGYAVSVGRGLGDGGFGGGPPFSQPADSPFHTAVATGDFNGDGKLDVVTTDSDADVWLGNGDGTLRYPLPFATGTGPASVVAGDFNGDGWLDIATGNSSGIVSVLLNDGNWSPQPPVVGDLNGDGKVNLFDINVVSAHWNESGPQGDANHDGAVNIFDINLISANWTTKNGEGGGGADATDSGPLRIASNSASGATSSMSGVLAGDLNADGRVDIFDINLLSAQWGHVHASQESNVHMMPELLGLNAILSNWGHVNTATTARVAILRAERPLDNLAADVVEAGTSTHSAISISQGPGSRRPLQIALPALRHNARQRSVAVDEVIGDEDFVTAHWDAHEDAAVASVVRGWFRQ